VRDSLNGKQNAKETEYLYKKNEKMGGGRGARRNSTNPFKTAQIKPVKGTRRKKEKKEKTFKEKKEKRGDTSHQLGGEVSWKKRGSVTNSPASSKSGVIRAIRKKSLGAVAKRLQKQHLKKKVHPLKPQSCLTRGS